MKQSDVAKRLREEQPLFWANVSGHHVQIRLGQPYPRGGWMATNTATGREIHVSARRLLGPVEGSPKGADR